MIFRLLPITLSRLVSVLFLFVLLGAVGCSGSSGGDDSTGSLRIIHLSSDTPDLDMLLDEMIVINDLTFPQESNYIPVNSGSRNIKINSAVTDSNLLELDVPVEAGSHTSIYLTGLLAQDDLEPLVLLDRNVFPESGNALIRIVHASPSAPSVGVYLGLSGEELGQGDLFVDNFPFRAFSGYSEVGAGVYQIRITETDTTNVIADTGDITIGNGDILTIATRDSAVAGQPMQLTILNDR